MEIYQTERPKLLSIAYQMLGSHTEAEDIVQDVFLKFSQMENGHIQNDLAYIYKMLVNRCINRLHTSRRSRELYVGPWLPEPIIFNDNDDPAQIVESRESISYAFTVLLDILTPLERAVFLLRETLQYEYQEIERVVEKSAIYCRKIHSRAKQKIVHSNASLLVPQTGSTTLQTYVDTFIRGVETGDFGEFIDHVTKDVRLVTDGGGRTIAALRPIKGAAKVSRFLHGIHKKQSLKGSARIVNVNGQPGIAVYREECLCMVICFSYADRRISDIYLIRNPDKLQACNW